MGPWSEKNGGGEVVYPCLAPRSSTRREDGPDSGLHMSQDDKRDPPGERLGARRRPVAEIVDVAVDRSPTIGLDRPRQMTIEVSRRCRSGGCHVHLNLVQARLARPLDFGPIGDRLGARPTPTPCEVIAIVGMTQR